MSDKDDNGIGITYAEAEYAKYKNRELAVQTMANVRREEHKHGYETGIRHVTGEDGLLKTVRVSVRFYPKVQFYISDVVDGQATNPRELTDEEYSGTYGLKL